MFLISSAPVDHVIGFLKDDETYLITISSRSLEMVMWNVTPSHESVSRTGRENMLCKVKLTKPVTKLEWSAAHGFLLSMIFFLIIRVFNSRNSLFHSSLGFVHPRSVEKIVVNSNSFHAIRNLPWDEAGPFRFLPIYLWILSRSPILSISWGMALFLWIMKTLHLRYSLYQLAKL